MEVVGEFVDSGVCFGLAVVVNGVSVVAEQYCFCFSLSRKQSCVVCVAEFDVTVIELVVAVAGEFF